MSIVMDMSSYWHEVTESDAESAESTNGANDYVPSLALQPLPNQTLQAGKMPADLATLDAELFLQRIYTYQR